MNDDGGHIVGPRTDDDSILVQLSRPEVGCACGWWQEVDSQEEGFLAFEAHQAAGHAREGQ